eukprot:gene14238-16800_t
MRGRSILYHLLQKQDMGEWGVDALQIVSGHVAMRYQMSRSIVVFDATIAQHHIGDEPAQHLQQILTNKQMLPPPATGSSSSLPILACSFPSPIVKFAFERSSTQGSKTHAVSNGSGAAKQASTESPLRLYVVEADAVLHVWEWVTLEYRWSYIVRFPLLATPVAGATLTHAAVFGSTQGAHITWMLANGPATMYTRSLNFDNNAKKRDLIRKETGTKLEEMQPANLAVTGVEAHEMRREWSEAVAQPTTRLITTKLGVWLVTRSFILLFSMRSRGWFATYYRDRPAPASAAPAAQCELHDLDLPVSSEPAPTRPGDNRGCIESVLDVCAHPSTQELMVLEPSGRLFIVDIGERETLRLTLAALLQPWTAPADLARVVMHQNAFVVMIGAKAFFYDLKCGTLLACVPTPIDTAAIRTGGAWSQGPSGVVWGAGLWARGEGLWEIRALSTTKLIESGLATHPIVHSQIQAGNARSSIGCAPAECRAWDLRRLEAKYLLDLALREKDEELKMAICKALLPKLENPSLVIALMSSLESDASAKFVDDELRAFLEAYNYMGGDDADSQENNIKLRKAFHYHTPLNQIMVPLLADYYDLQRVTREALVASSVPNEEVAKIGDGRILEATNEAIELLKRRAPSALLQQLERSLGLDQIDLTKFGDLQGEMEPMPRVHDALLQHEDMLKRKTSPKQLHANAAPATSPIESTECLTSFPLFETMCQLYYEINPRNLVGFVRVVYNGACERTNELQANTTFTSSASTSMEVTKFIPQNDHFTRALLALPSTLPLPSEANDKIDARFKLLCAVGHKSNALRFLLATGRWDQAFQMVKNTGYSDKDHFSSASTTPTPNTPTQPISIVSTQPNEELTIDMFRGQLLKIFGRGYNVVQKINNKILEDILFELDEVVMG